MIERIRRLFNLGAARCFDCDVTLAEFDPDTMRLRDKGRRHYQRCAPCYRVMVNRWAETNIAR